MIPPHNIYQIYHSLSVRDDCTPPKCGEDTRQEREGSDTGNGSFNTCGAYR